ncbi:beta 1-4 rhamnosyltransferase Cps2T [Limosilactobacillus fermentum]|uniref:beta 1-4 rhamnosyltransferase Cps2T n=1 Tax=Limosilactobacillus fermentum TaxID=1613 RepID=UPI00196257BC|nr:DUF1972 domain-containing protein [Limosilactobacillus fermentum]MBM9561369.1 DUF1972 domain-containing protein [Limosilactobacillus fermentum]
MQDIFIVGAKGIGNYGGYETFLKKLIETDRNDMNIRYHVACKYNGQGAMNEKLLSGAKSLDDHHFQYYNANCFKINVPKKLGSAQAVYYDIAALKKCINQIQKGKIKHPIIYILACRIGPFMGKYARRIHSLGGKIYVNPDGHEWMRAKWPKVVRKYWKLSESGMVKHADLLICDSVNIEKYIQKEYKRYNPNTTFIAYGADVRKSVLSDNSPKFKEWLAKSKLKVDNYYLIVGRFVPENNFETMIREFMRSKSKKDLAIITTSNSSFLNSLNRKLHFDKDSRIKFVGTVYNQELLKKIRENAYGYIHGHSVGGTNPSLLEALGSTKLNLLLDVGFNKEVGYDAALYWNKDNGNLASLINLADGMRASTITRYDKLSTQRIKEKYSWKYILNKYKKVWGN